MAFKFAKTTAVNANTDSPAGPPPLPTLWADPEYIRASDELAMLQNRLNTAEARRRKAVRKIQGKKSSASVMDRAAALVSGASIIPANPRGEIDAADEEIVILRVAISEKTLEINEIKERFSFELSQQFIAEHRAAFLDAFHGALAMADGFRRMFEIFDEIRESGATPNHCVLVDYMPYFARLAGQPDTFNSHLRPWVVWMNEHGFDVEVTDAKS